MDRLRHEDAYKVAQIIVFKDISHATTRNTLLWVKIRTVNMNVQSTLILKR